MQRDIVETARPSAPDRPTPSTRVLEAVAEAEGVSPVALDALVDTIETAALDALVAGSDASVEVTFEYEGHEVTVPSRGPVLVE